MMIFVFFMDSYTMGREFLSRPFFQVCGKLCFITALITPLMIQLIYSTLPGGLYVSFNRVFQLGFGNVIAVMVTGLLLYIIVEFPLRRLLEWSILHRLSSDKAVHKAYVQQEEEKEVN